MRALIGISVFAVICSDPSLLRSKAEVSAPLGSGPPGSETQAAVLNAVRRLPIRFELNRGQTDGRVKFLSRSAGHTLLLIDGEAILSLPGPQGERAARLRLAWVSANKQARVSGVDELPGKSHYLIGADPRQWHTQVPMFAKVRYENIYPGIDLLYYGQGGNLEYDFIVAPGARPDVIRLKIDGADRVRLDPGGDVIINVASEEVRFRKPSLYQVAPAGGPGPQSARQPVDGRYVVTPRGEVGLEIGAYDLSRPLVIDPLLTYSSYLGGSGSDSAKSITLDSSGNAYIVGSSASVDFPTMSALQATNAGVNNAVIIKLNPELPGAASLVYSTYLGGNSNTLGRGIAVDAAGNIFVTGDTTSSNFPVTAGAYQTSFRGSSDVFAAKLDPTGSTLLYSTYLGGTGSEFGFALAIDTAGHMFLTGPTGSPDFPVTAGAYQSSFAGGGTKFGDMFIVELNPAGRGAADLLYSTYLGGSGSETSFAIAVDQSGAIYVGGTTTSANFPTTAGAYATAYSGSGSLGNGDSFVTKLRPAGGGTSDLLYSTYLGGNQDDKVEGIALDTQNRVYVTGFTTSRDFPVRATTAYQPAFGGGGCSGGPCADAFLAKLDPAISGPASLLYSTFFGGSSFDLGHAIVLDNAGLVYITGESASINLPLVNPIQGVCFGGCRPVPMDDTFVAKFDLSQSGAAGLLFSTYLGGDNVDTGWGIAVDSNANAVVTGVVFSQNFPTVMPYQPTCDNCTSFTDPAPSGDIFVYKLCTTGCPAISVQPNSLVFQNQIVNSTSTAQTVTILNSGTGDLTLVGIGITGANAGEFSESNNCPVVLSPQTSCTVSVTFTPLALGVRTAALTIFDNASGSPRTVSLSGTGVPVLICSDDKTVACGSAWTFDPPSAMGFCAGTNVTITIVSTITNGSACSGGITRTWQATDPCSNSATCSQTVTITDTTPPMLTCNTNKTVECGAAWSFDQPTAVDACCGTNVTLTILSTVTQGDLCQTTVTRTWQATDCCSNSATCSQTVTIIDTTPPMLTCNTNKTVECGSAWSFDQPTALDACCGTNVTLTVLSTVTNGNLGQMTITRTWQATDCCSNSATCSQTVTNIDTTPPVLTCATNKTVECGSAWSFDQPTAVDACCGTNVTLTILSTVTNGNLGQMTITRTWQATDCCSNSATCSQTVTNIDTTPPVLTCATNKTVECGAAWSFDQPTAVDACCGTNVTLTVLSTVTQGDLCQTTVTRTWQATDCCSNSATCSQTVTIIDTTPPMLTCNTNKTVECGSAWSFDQPTALDACCGTNVTITIVSTITNGSACSGGITRTWQATDPCSNSATCSQTVTITDTTPPVLTCPNNLVVTTCETNVVVTWVITASDNCGTFFTSSDPPSGSQFAVGTTNTVVAWAWDSCANTNRCEFTVAVVPSTPGNLAISFSEGTITLTWNDGVLQQADEVFGTYTDVDGAASPYTIAASASRKYYRLRCGAP